MRAAWGKAYGRLIRPGGVLIALMWPVEASRDRSVGPPFPIEPEDYDKALAPAGFVREHVSKVPDDVSVERRRGLEMVGIYRRV